MLLSLNQAETARTWSRFLLALLFAATAAVVGHLSKSDTFHGVAVMSFCAFFALKLFERAFSRRALTTSSALGAIGLVAVPLLILSAAPLLGDDSIATKIVNSLAKDNGESVGKEADLRVQIWRRALERGAEASMMGLGPGPHLEIPSEIISERRTTNDINVAHPEVNITANFESHNIFLEMYLQGGLIAALALAWLLLNAVVKAYANSIFLAIALLGITTFGLTNVNLRQPIYWFSIALCLTSEQRSATRRLSAATSSHKVFALC
ncbi:O-antigen ligase family protein [Methylocystis sp. JAN1]|uniref:O-antigen ligase family protein n=1 Tax=Methylocystis sp. JAN1 TaxID=3397211 RepID=UPI003FA2DD13